MVLLMLLLSTILITFPTCSKCDFRRGAASTRAIQIPQPVNIDHFAWRLRNERLACLGWLANVETNRFNRSNRTDRVPISTAWHTGEEPMTDETGNLRQAMLAKATYASVGALKQRSLNVSTRIHRIAH